MIGSAMRLSRKVAQGLIAGLEDRMGIIRNTIMRMGVWMIS